MPQRVTRQRCKRDGDAQKLVEIENIDPREHDAGRYFGS